MTLRFLSREGVFALALLSIPGQVLAQEESLPLYTRIKVLLDQPRDFAAPEEARSGPQIETMISNIAVYGSLRGRMRVSGARMAGATPS